MSMRKVTSHEARQMQHGHLHLPYPVFRKNNKHSKTNVFEINSMQRICFSKNYVELVDLPDNKIIENRKNEK